MEETEQAILYNQENKTKQAIHTGEDYFYTPEMLPHKNMEHYYFSTSFLSTNIFNDSDGTSRVSHPFHAHVHAHHLQHHLYCESTTKDW